mmetsp:Transcript_4937/g.12810  ORF Transcript_4937/g.12810 Transcript_4937/m.12810 type:complete len:532 (-) Transcript_4937:1943-3538(-)
MAKSVVTTSRTVISPDGTVKQTSSTRTIHHAPPAEEAAAAAATPPPAALVASVKKAGQAHVLSFWDQLSAGEQEALVADVGSVDVAALSKWYVAATRYSDSPDGAAAKLEPIPQDAIVTNTSTEPTPQVSECREVGLTAIGEGKVAAVLMAGGQGTRLGSKKPKGMFPLGLDVDPTLFQLQAHRLRRLAELGKAKTGRKCAVPWYIMTSGATKPDTVAFLKDNDYFGLNPDDVFIFEQNIIPCLTPKGQMILKSKSALARAPDGNGGLYRAVREAGVLDDMVKRGIEFVHIYGVDNALVQIADPIFVGTVAQTGADVGNKSCLKRSPTEPVGVICIKNGKYQVVEYSEMDEATCERRRDDGQLLFSAGNVCNHLYTLDFFKRACKLEEESCVHHVASKKIPHVDASGTYIEPKEPNGIKLEKFVFDVFVLAEKLTVLEISRDEEFSPLKNASAAGKDCVDTVQKMLYARNRRYLEAAGATFVDADGKALDPATLTEEHVCEISPLVSYAGEGLEDVVKAGSPFQFPVYIRK